VITVFQEERTRLNICGVGWGASFQNLVGEKLLLSISWLMLLLSLPSFIFVEVVVVCNQSQRKTLRSSTSFRHNSNIRLLNFALKIACSCANFDDDLY